MAMLLSLPSKKPVLKLFSWHSFMTSVLSISFHCSNSLFNSASTYNYRIIEVTILYRTIIRNKKMNHVLEAITFKYGFTIVNIKERICNLVLIKLISELT